MADEDKRCFLFVAIDRASRWIFIVGYAVKTAAHVRRFLVILAKAAPFHLQTLLTDNGKAFTDRFISAGERKPTWNMPLTTLSGTGHQAPLPFRP